MGKYAHWQPHMEEGIPSDNRFVAVLSDTTQFSRTNRVARRGAVEVVETDGGHITVRYALTFEGSEEITPRNQPEVGAREEHRAWSIGAPFHTQERTGSSGVRRP